MDEHDETQTTMPQITEPAPPSDEFDSVLHAKDRAAVAIFTSIEALANGADVNAGKLDSLTHAFARMNDTLKAEPDAFLSETGVFGTTLSPTDAKHLEALSAFYNGVRHQCGLVGTRIDEPISTPLRIQETLEAVGQLWQRATNAEESLGGAGATVRELTEQLDAARRECTAWRNMHEQLGFVVREEHAKLGIAPRLWLSPEESAKVAVRFADLTDSDRARYAGTVAQIRQIVEHHKKTMDEFDAISRGDVRPRQGCEIAGRIRKLFDELKEANALLIHKDADLKTAQAFAKDANAAIKAARKNESVVDSYPITTMKDRLSSAEADLTATRATIAELRNECGKLRAELAEVDAGLSGIPNLEHPPAHEYVSIQNHRLSVINALRDENRVKSKYCDLVKAALLDVGMELSIHPNAAIHRLADQRDKALKMLAQIEDLVDGTVSDIETGDRILVNLQIVLREANGVRKVHGALLQKLYALYYKWKGGNGTSPTFALLLKEAINSALGEDAVGITPSGTNEIGAIMGVAKHQATGGETVQIDFAKP